ncbi:MAG: hypothetical protein QHH14_01115 [Clostridiales bacterium]|nr:hypothetical protein [Clostridiales bacterium]
MKKPAYSKPKYREPKIFWTGPLFMEKRVADRIEKENMTLGKMVSDLRERPIRDKDAQEKFLKTYLKNPVLKRRGRRTSTGWKDVLKELRIIVDKHNLSKIQSRVTLAYTPLKKGTPGERDIDLNVHVMTTLFFKSDDMAVLIEGDLFHRRPCPIDP